MADVRGVTAVAGPLAVAESGWRQRIPQIRHRWTHRRGFAVILTVLVVFYAGRWLYDNHISTPSPLPLPASTAVSLVETPSTTWPTPNGGLYHTRTTNARPALDGDVAWQVDLPEWVLRAPVADEERIYITYRDSFAAFAIEDGRELWQFAQPGLVSAPAIVGDRLYLALRTGEILAIEGATGDVVWSTKLGQELFTTPLPFRGVLYVFGPGRIYGIDAENGDRLWDGAVEGNWGEMAPIVNDDHIVVAARRAVVVLDRKTGVRTFRHPHTSTTGLVFGDALAYSVSPSFAAAIDPLSTLPWWEGTRLYWNWLWAFGAAPVPPRPEVEWVSRVRPSELRAGTGFRLMFRPAFDGERLITSDTTGTVRAFDAATGVLVWEAELSALHGPPTVTPDGLVLPLTDAFVLLDIATGELLDSRPLETIGTRVQRWVVVVDQGTFVVDAPGSALLLR